MRFRASWLWIAVMAMASAGPLAGSVGAIVIDRINAGSANMSAPSDDPGWNNVGAIGFGGGIYIGYGWVLTANHVVGSGDGITLGGVKYAMLPGTGRQLTNAAAAGKSASTDLYMFQIATPSLSLPFIHVASTAPANGESVTMIGRGRLQQANPTFWDINDSSNPWIWTETTEALANEAGFKTDGTNSMRWGTNAIDDRGWFNVGVDVLGIGTTFDPYVSNNEAQVVSGDSGGAVFVKQAGAWNLAGIIIAQGLLPNQPGGTSTAAFYNTSYFADLSYYRPQIVAIVVPEPAAMTQLLAAGGIGLGVWWCRRRRAG